jgi:hypothetical protein
MQALQQVVTISSIHGSQLGVLFAAPLPLGWIMVLEWIDQYHVSTSGYSKQFCFGSDLHKEIVNKLEQPQYDEPTDISSDLFKQEIWKSLESYHMSSHSATGNAGFWTAPPATNNLVYKMKVWNVAQLGYHGQPCPTWPTRGRGQTPRGSPRLVEASLLFGRGILAVCTPFLRQRCPKQVELTSDDWKRRTPSRRVWRKALLGLACRGVLYTDLRAANVLVCVARVLWCRSAWSIATTCASRRGSAMHSARRGRGRVLEGVCSVPRGWQAHADGGVDFSSGTVYLGVWKAVGELAPQPVAGDGEPKRRRRDEPHGS